MRENKGRNNKWKKKKNAGKTKTEEEKKAAKRNEEDMKERGGREGEGGNTKRRQAIRRHTKQTDSKGNTHRPLCLVVKRGRQRDEAGAAGDGEQPVAVAFGNGVSNCRCGTLGGGG